MVDRLGFVGTQLGTTFPRAPEEQTPVREMDSNRLVWSVVFAFLGKGNLFIRYSNR